MKETVNRNFAAGEIYAITASAFSRGRSNVEVMRQALESGVKIVQYREKDYSMKKKYEECCQIRELTARHGAVFIVNDDIHLAMAVGADGVHLGQDDLPLEKAKDILGDGYILGLSTHSPEQARAAVDAGADYIGVGPLFSTHTKKDVCEPVGLAYLDHVVRTHDIPFVAIGGIKAHNVAQIICRGAWFIAIVSGITEAEDIPAYIALVRGEIEKGQRLLHGIAANFMTN